MIFSHFISYCYSYALNNPLLYTDPTGNYVAPFDNGLFGSGGGANHDFDDNTNLYGNPITLPEGYIAGFMNNSAGNFTSGPSFEQYIHSKWYDSWGTPEVIANSLWGLADQWGFASLNLQTWDFAFGMEGFQVVHPELFYLAMAELGMAEYMSNEANCLAYGGDGDEMGFQVNWGLGGGFKSPFGSLMVKVGTVPWFSSELNVDLNTTSLQVDPNQINLLSIDYALPLINVGGEFSIIGKYGNLGFNYGVSWFGFNYSGLDGIYSGGKWGVHLGIIGVEGYIKSSNILTPIIYYENAKRNFYEQTGGFMWRR